MDGRLRQDQDALDLALLRDAARIQSAEARPLSAAGWSEPEVRAATHRLTTAGLLAARPRELGIAVIALNGDDDDDDVPAFPSYAEDEATIVSAITPTGLDRLKSLEAAEDAGRRKEVRTMAVEEEQATRTAMLRSGVLIAVLGVLLTLVLSDCSSGGK